MIKPITIASRQLKSNLFQGPLAGYSCAPFRELIWQFGGVGFCTTEMISAKDLVNRAGQYPQRYLFRAQSEGPLCYQLSGDNAQDVARACVMVSELGADFIDLNCGCPKNKIRTKGCGSKLLSRHQTLENLIQAMRKNTSVPISIKIRVDGQSGDNNNLIVAKIAEDNGADFLIVHGRHWQDDYDVACHWQQVADIVDTVSIPVIANGDGKNLASVENILRQTHCAGVMISRASMGKPWLFHQIQNPDFVSPTLTTVIELLLQHVTGLMALEDERKAIFQSRSFVKYYLRDYFHNADFYEALNHCQRYEDFQKLLSGWAVVSRR